jgi:hypothetical protein
MVNDQSFFSDQQLIKKVKYYYFNNIISERNKILVWRNLFPQFKIIFLIKMNRLEIVSFNIRKY